jgi:hypothetical protein
MPEAPSPRAASALGRLHLVFVPGFGGFDALGELEYYAGTTDAFQAFCESERSDAWGSRVVVHYFDTLPTAGVRTRARLLCEYLTGRAKRHEFHVGEDRIALIAHSTGCLDVRQMLCDLDARRNLPTSRRGVDANAREHIEGEQLLGLISRVVFLSAPQRGTNIADWVRNQPNSARSLMLSLVAKLADGLDFPGLIAARKSMPWLLEAVSRVTLGTLRSVGGPAGFLQAFEDLGREVSKIRHRDPWVAANSRIALAKVQLWLDQAEADFLAIDDLACEPPARAGEFDCDLARRSEAARAREKERWQADGIVVRSYATRGPSPLPAPTGPTSRLAPWPKVLRSLRPRPGERKGTDAPYRIVHTACATGPFSLVEDRATDFFTGKTEIIKATDNDGAVNTGSMLWPNGADTLLIDADHGDIIGHFEEGFATGSQAELRTRVRYDIFGSAAGFDRARFEAVWFDIFKFCATAEPRTDADSGTHSR